MADTTSIVLVNPPICEGSYRHQPYMPIGLAYLAAVLEKAGHQVKVLDCAALSMSFQELKTRIVQFKPDIVGVTAMTPTVGSALKVASLVKEVSPSTLVVFGGVHPTFMDKEMLREVDHVDVIIRGEGEHTIIDLVSALEERRGLKGVLGITYREEGSIYRNPERPYIENLDDLPKPGFRHFPLEKYRVFGRKILPVVSSRGCPFQCSFCVTSRVFGRKVRMRSPINVVDEVEWLKKEHGADAVTFYDDTFTFSKERVERICEEIMDRGLNIPWDCQTRADCLSPELLKKMRDAGCEAITLGVESASPNILRAVGKGTSPEQNEKAVRIIKEAGISVIVSVIIGYPGETMKDVNLTLEFIKKLKPDDAYLCIATPYPGTELYRLVKEKGWKMLDDWSKYDTLTPTFENPETPPKQLLEARRKFYDTFYSPIYIFRQVFKGGFYNRILARTAVNHLIWRIRATL
ncbi:MAG: B12-binding domain-containing radical SAM protein [Candidatus Bathyarchaeota archaeon]|nr:B12-binding domain-containing radical SAM protein [Candidatus Bathyarchaeota archaeon]